MTKLLLVDGHALAYRSYHALADTPMTTSRGEQTNAIYGFASTLLKTLQTQSPTHVAVCFDLPAPTFRHREFTGYKAHRPPMDDAMRGQMDRLRELVAALNFPTYQLAGFEADDMLGSLARQAAGDGVETVILTGDLDTLQLVDQHVRVLTPGRGRFDIQMYDVDAVLQRYGLTPVQIPDYKALVGDKSDNIPGVPGVGEKTASKLLEQFGSIEALFEHLEELPPRSQKLLAGRQAQAVASKYLATIVVDVPVTLDLDRGRVKDIDREAAFRLFTELEFRSLIDRLPALDDLPSSVPAAPIAAPVVPPVPTEPAPPSLFDQLPAGVADTSVLSRHTVRGSALPTLFDAPEIAEEQVVSEPADTQTTVAYVIDTEESFAALLTRLDQRAEWSLDLETTSKDPIGAEVVGIALAADPGIAYYIPVGHLEGVQLSRERVLAGLRPWLERDESNKVGHNLKYDITVLLGQGIVVRGVRWDTMVAAYLLNPAQRGLGLKDQAAQRFQLEMQPITSLIGTGRGQKTMAEVSIVQAAQYAAEDADVTLRLRQALEPELREKDLFTLFEQVEMPLVPVLAAMECAGIDLDVDFLRIMSAELQQQFEALALSIFELVGHEFNINAPRQLEAVLFRERGLPPGRRTASGYSTDAEVLESLRGRDPVVDKVLEYRQLTKLRSTYVEGLPKLINPRTGKLHTSFNQTIAATGRLSSSEPNLQNIPIRTELGHKIRRAFIVRQQDWVMLAADYSQIELRILAHLSGDERLVEAFRTGQDIHASTAALVFGVPPEQVTPDMRRLAKTVNFGIIYGLSAFGLAPRTGVSQSEARAFINTYNASYPQLYAYMESTREEARQRGFVTTLLNRRRYIPDVNSSVRSVREEALRQAVNMPVQGAAADMIKLAMIGLHRNIPAAGLHGQMILQVHDELVLRLPESELRETARLVKDTMEHALTLTVPIAVDLKWGHDWYTMTALDVGESR